MKVTFLSLLLLLLLLLLGSEGGGGLLLFEEEGEVWRAVKGRLCVFVMCVYNVYIACNVGVRLKDIN